MLPLLHGVRVLELTSVVMGPFAGQILADLGAEVVRVEPLSGDVARETYPASTPGMGALYVNNNRNKRSIALDMKSVDGMRIVERLILRSDVLLHNMRMDAIERLGFGYAAASAINPRLIYCSAIGFGQGGRYRNRPAFDDIIQAASGFAALGNLSGGAPSFAPTLLADKVGALYAVYGILAALVSRAAGNSAGVHVEMPMFESTVSFLFNEHLAGATFSESTEGVGYHRLLSPNRKPHRTRDGWIAVLPYTADQWTRALVEMGRDDIIASEWFGDPVERSRRADYLYGELAAALEQRDTAEWIQVLTALDVPCSEVSTMTDLLDDPHLSDVGFFDVDATYPPDITRAVPQPVRFHGLDVESDQPPPALGAHSLGVLHDCGFAEAEIAELIATGVVSQAPVTQERGAHDGD